MAKTRLRNILNILSPDGTAVDFTEFDAGVAKLKAALTEKIQAKTLEDVNAQLERFRQRTNFTPLIETLTAMEESVVGKVKDVSAALESKIAFLRIALQTGDAMVGDLSSTVEGLRGQLAFLEAQTGEIATLRTRVASLPSLETVLEVVRGMMENDASDDAVEKANLVADYTEQINTVRREVMNRLNTFSHGGQANRNIAVNGNGSILSRYGDVNFKAGTNVTLTVADNNTTKQTDITITASGGAGVNPQTPAGTVNGSNVSFTCTGVVQVAVADGTIDTGAVITGAVNSSITYSVPPQNNVYAF